METIWSIYHVTLKPISKAAFAHAITVTVESPNKDRAEVLAKTILQSPNRWNIISVDKIAEIVKNG